MFGLCSGQFMKVSTLWMVLIVLPYVIVGYPVFGTARYGGSTIPMRRTAPQWGMTIPAYSVPSYQPANHIRNQMSHYPSTYYEAMYPYTQDYLDDYYYPVQEPINYPIYYPPARPNAKYNVYQAAAVPYYYEDQRIRQPAGYGYYNFEDNSDPVVDLQEEMLQEEEREEREEALPIGQETWYEGEVPNQNEESIEDVNAAFLQNLIMSHMYNDALKSKTNTQARKNMEGIISGDERDYIDDPTVWYSDTKLDNNRYYTGDYEDEEVRELKSLQKAPVQKNLNEFKKDRKQRILNAPNNKKQSSGLSMDPNDDDMWINWNNKRNYKEKMNKIIQANKKQELSQHGSRGPSYSTIALTDRKPASIIAKEPKKMLSTVAPSSSSTVAPVTEGTTRDARRGQKEVVLLRPATPVRHPFAEPVMTLLSHPKEEEGLNKRAPSVYDTIKQLLYMEDNLKENSNEYTPKHSNMKKRFATNEGSLVNELVGLKKMST